MPLRKALIGVGLTCFLAGSSVGFALRDVDAVLAMPSADRHAAYVERFRDTYQLRPEQARDLRAVLLSYDDERMRIAQQFDLEQWPSEARSQLRNAQRRMELRVEFLLDETQRERYRRDANSASAAAANPPGLTRPTPEKSR